MLPYSPDLNPSLTSLLNKDMSSPILLSFLNQRVSKTLVLLFPNLYEDYYTIPIGISSILYPPIPIPLT